MADFDDFMPRDDKPLDPKEVSELDEALGDGFTSVTLLRDTGFGTLEGVVEEQFWGAKIRAAEFQERHFEEFSEDLRSEGFTEGEIAEKYADYVEEELEPDAPRWYESNPFSFDPKKLEKYFTTRCDASLGDLKSLLARNGGDYTHADLVASVRPYSRTWYELHIAHEFWLLRGFFNDLQKDNAISAFWVMAMIRRAGALGRMIESYRWRFAYGGHALRGKKVYGSASEGGRARAGSLKASTNNVLKAMAPLVGRGLSVRRSAEIVASRGMGASADANRKLWQRHLGARAPNKR